MAPTAAWETPSSSLHALWHPGHRYRRTTSPRRPPGNGRRADRLQRPAPRRPRQAGRGRGARRGFRPNRWSEFQAVVQASCTRRNAVAYGTASQRDDTNNVLAWAWLFTRLGVWSLVPNGRRALFYNFWAGKVISPKRFWRRIAADGGLRAPCRATITPHVAARMPLADAGPAMTLAESRTAYGKVVLIPSTSVPVAGRCPSEHQGAVRLSRNQHYLGHRMSSDRPYRVVVMPEREAEGGPQGPRGSPPLSSRRGLLGGPGVLGSRCWLATVRAVCRRWRRRWRPSRSRGKSRATPCAGRRWDGPHVRRSRAARGR